MSVGRWLKNETAEDSKESHSGVRLSHDCAHTALDFLCAEFINYSCALLCEVSALM